jgi:hypothetical protein
MKLLSLFLYAALAVCVTGCNQEPQEISIVQQYSNLQYEWQDIALVHGLAFENVELAEITRDAFAAAYPEAEYRVVTRTMPQWKYERLKKQIEVP